MGGTYPTGGGSSRGSQSAGSAAFRQLINKPLGNDFNRLMHQRYRPPTPMNIGSVPKAMRLLRGAIRFRHPLQYALETLMGVLWTPTYPGAYDPYTDAPPTNYQLECSIDTWNAIRSGGANCGVAFQICGPPWTGNQNHVLLNGFNVLECDMDRARMVARWRRMFRTTDAGVRYLPGMKRPYWIGDRKYELPSVPDLQRPFEWMKHPVPGKPQLPAGPNVAPGGEGGSGESPGIFGKPSKPPIPDIVIGPGTKPGVQPPTHKPKPPPGRVKERKYVLALRGVAQMIVGFSTETLDFIKAVHGGLPKRCQAKPTFKDGKWWASTPQAKLEAIYKSSHCLDMCKVLYTLGYNEIEDFAYGKLGQIVAKANSLRDASAGLTFGPSDTEGLALWRDEGYRLKASEPDPGYQGCIPLSDKRKCKC